MLRYINVILCMWCKCILYITQTHATGMYILYPFHRATHLLRNRTGESSIQIHSSISFINWYSHFAVHTFRQHFISLFRLTWWQRLRTRSKERPAKTIATFYSYDMLVRGSRSSLKLAKFSCVRCRACVWSGRFFCFIFCCFSFDIKFEFVLYSKK